MRTVLVPPTTSWSSALACPACSAALQLAGQADDRSPPSSATRSGGRMGQADVRGYRIDTGPNRADHAGHHRGGVLFAVGASMVDRLDLAPVDPAYRASFADGSSWTCTPTPRPATAAVEEFAGPTRPPRQRLRTG